MHGWTLLPSIPAKFSSDFFKTIIPVLIYISGSKVDIWASIFIFSSSVTQVYSLSLCTWNQFEPEGEQCVYMPVWKQIASWYAIIILYLLPFENIGTPKNQLLYQTGKKLFMFDQVGAYPGKHENVSPLRRKLSTTGGTEKTTLVAGLGSGIGRPFQRTGVPTYYPVKQL